MDTFMQQLLMNSALSGMRQDEAVARQGVMNHQTTAHLMDLSFTEKAVKMDIAESFAAQGLSHANAPRDAMGLRTAVHVPSSDKP